MENGADIEKQDSAGASADIRRGRKDNLAIIKEILAIKPELIDTVTKENNTPLMVAIVAQNWKVAGYLIERGADINVKAENGATALLIAIMKKNEDLARLLIGKGADINAKCVVNGANVSCFMLAGLNKLTDLLLLLSSKGAKI
jgi:ankyrin repeat protein